MKFEEKPSQEDIGVPEVKPPNGVGFSKPRTRQQVMEEDADLSPGSGFHF